MSDAPRLSRDAVARLSDRLRDDAERLAHDLLPGGDVRAGLYRAARRQYGGPGDSLTVYLRGPRRGKWRHFGGSLNGIEHGDMLDLIMATQRLGKEDARAWALRWLGIEPGGVDYRRTPEEEAAARKAASEKRREQMEKVARRRKSDWALWGACTPITLGNAGGQYLRDRIPGFQRLLDLEWGMHTLRHHPALIHPFDERGRAFPAMLALCLFPNGKIAGLHRYFLTKRPNGRWDVLRPKLDGLEGKLSSTSLEGGFVPLWRGSRMDPETGEFVAGWPWRDERAGPDVVISEGVENGLSLAAVKPDRRYAAAISLPNFGFIKLPDWARTVVWFKDDDGDNPQTPGLLDRALERLEEQGRDVAIASPPPGFKDANDALRGLPPKEPT